MHWNIHGKYKKQSSPMTHLDHKDLGWFPNPKGEYTEFWNAGSILPKFCVLLDHLSLQGMLSPLFCGWKKTPVGSSWDFKSNKSQVGFCDQNRCRCGNITTIKIWTKAGTGQENIQSSVLNNVFYSTNYFSLLGVTLSKKHGNLPVGPHDFKP